MNRKTLQIGEGLAVCERCHVPLVFGEKYAQCMNKKCGLRAVGLWELNGEICNYVRAVTKPGMQYRLQSALDRAEQEAREQRLKDMQKDADTLRQLVRKELRMEENRRRLLTLAAEIEARCAEMEGEISKPGISMAEYFTEIMPEDENADPVQARKAAVHYVKKVYVSNDRFAFESTLSEWIAQKRPRGRF